MSRSLGDCADTLDDLARRVAEAHDYLGIAEAQATAQRLEAEASEPSLWDDPDHARSVTTALARVRDDIDRYERAQAEIADAQALAELAYEADQDEQAELVGELGEALAAADERMAEIELMALFSGEHDDSDAVCQINSGAGGTDACDWAEMLLRMYQRWAERNQFQVELTEATAGGETGLSSATFLVRGRHAFGFLAAERGVHRLVRISPYDSASRRHTAFASLSVVPFFEEVSDEVPIDEGDLRIDTYRSSGAGGQHVNVTDSAVRITHLPTGIVVACQNERSQHQNKERAMQMLAAKLADLQRTEREAEVAALAGEQRDVAWGSQIRSYVLQPYQQVKDHRSGMEIGNVDAVLDGDLGGLMEAFLRWQRARQAQPASAGA